MRAEEKEARLPAPDDDWTFSPAPKLPDSERTVAPERTFERVRPLLRRVPVTRIADVTRLDPVGLPVFSAATPLAADLRVHMGKGMTPMAARVSAVMEAIERVSAERAEPGIRASFAELSARGGARRPVDPAAFELPSDTRYAPDRPLDWLPARDLLRGEDAWLAADLALSPPREGVLVDVDTNGLASGNTRLEAIVHGLCEVVERDCFSQHYFCSLFSDPADPRPAETALRLDTLPPSAREWASRVTGAGLDLLVWDITSELGVPTYLSSIVDHALSGTSAVRRFYGLGTHPNATVAVTRSVSEAVQSRLGVVQAARDSYNRLRAKPREATIRADLRSASHGHRASFADRPSHAFGDVRDDLRFLLDRLERAGFDRCLVVDLTRPDLGIPVVRVRVPGMTEFYVNMRRVGWRCRRHLL